MKEQLKYLTAKDRIILEAAIKPNPLFTINGAIREIINNKRREELKKNNR